MEGDPHPGAIKGYMPFQSFNPSIDASRKVKIPEISYDYWPPVLLFWLLFSSLKGQVTSNIQWWRVILILEQL